MSIGAVAQDIHGRVKRSGVVDWQTLLDGILYLAVESCLGCRIVPLGIVRRRQSSVSHSTRDIPPYSDQQAVALAVRLEDGVGDQRHKLELDLVRREVGIYVAVAKAVVEGDANGRSEGDGGAGQQKQRHGEESRDTGTARRRAWWCSSTRRFSIVRQGWDDARGSRDRASHVAVGRRIWRS